ncbi:MAG TPA: NAD-dependent epimerase/dehydratase family protein, partial [Actinomycetota bacterium]|nr:NAD-dependent epimerase/dehydratase family protein [Actinomycetota bacterium]
MKTLVAGATGDIGVPVVRRLLDRGHDVVGITRSEQNRARLERMGARGVVASVLDRDALPGLVEDAQPDAVVDLLTALPRTGPRRPSHLPAPGRR